MLDNTFQENELLDAFSWHLLLPIIERPRVLSIAPPDMAHLVTLGRLFGKVTSLDSGQSPLSVEESVPVAGQERIHKVRGNIFFLPFRNESFDLLVVNGLSSDQHGGRTVQRNRRMYQEALLENLHRILAMNGCICLCTPNRWDYRELLEGKNSAIQEDRGEASGGRMGNLTSVLRTYRRLSSHLLSPKRYVKILRDAGFSDVQAYVAFPDCRMPRFVVPFDQGVYRYYRHHFTYPHGEGLRKILGRLIARSGIDRFLESHLLITGVKS